MHTKRRLLKLGCCLGNALFILLGLTLSPMMLYLGISSFHDELELNSKGVVTDAMVIDKQVWQDSGTDRFCIQFQFTVGKDNTIYSHSDRTGGRNLCHSVTEEQWRGLQSADQVSVEYLPDNPRVNRLADGDTTSSVNILVCSVFLGLAPWLVLLIVRVYGVKLILPDDIVAIDKLFATLTKQDEEQQIRTIRRLGQIGGQHVFEGFTGLLKIVTGETRYAVLCELEGDPERAWPILIQELSNPDHITREVAAGLLGNLKDARTVPALMKCLEYDSDTTVRVGAATSLGRIADVRAIPALAWAERRDRRYDRSGHSVAWAATGAISHILQQQVINHVTQSPEAQIERLYDDGSQLSGKIKYLPNDPPYLDARTSNNPYRNLPSKAFGPISLCKMTAESLHRFPFAVEVIFTYVGGRARRDFVFSRRHNGWAIETIIQPESERVKRSPRWMR